MEIEFDRTEWKFPLRGLVHAVLYCFGLVIAHGSFGQAPASPVPSLRPNRLQFLPRPSKRQRLLRS